MAVKHIIANKKFIMTISIDIYGKRKMSCILITLEMPHNLKIIIKCIYSAVSVFNKNISWLIKSTEIAYSHSIWIDSVKCIFSVWYSYNSAILSCCRIRSLCSFLNFSCTSIKNKHLKILCCYNLVIAIAIYIVYLHRHIR